MKQPKKLTRDQKECLAGHGLNWRDWMLVEELDGVYVVSNKKTKEIKWIGASR